jgi:hypothetical protein
MIRIINILVFIPILIIGCNKSNKIQTINEDIEDVSVHISTEIQEHENLNIIMYVNSPEGLRVRNLPGINGDRIGLLDYLTEVKIIKEYNVIASIEGIEGKWVNIIKPIEGWVFNGFLENEEQHKHRLNRLAEESVIIGVWGLLNDDSQHHYYKFYPDKKYWEGFMFGRNGEWYIHDNVLTLIEKYYDDDSDEGRWIIPDEIIIDFLISIDNDYTITLDLINNDVIDKIQNLGGEIYLPKNRYLSSGRLQLKRIEMMEKHYWWHYNEEKFW